MCIIRGITCKDELKYNITLCKPAHSSEGHNSYPLFSVHLSRYFDALIIATKHPKEIRSLVEPHVKTVLESLDIPAAIALYRAMGLPAVVSALRKIEVVHLLDTRIYIYREREREKERYIMPRMFIL